jgi:two-component system, LytTR family, sensor kinase
VRDDGPGMDETKKAIAIQGIGLRNTRSRLDKLYGPAHSFRLSPAEGGGLQATITLPFHTGNGTEESSNGENSSVDR